MRFVLTLIIVILLLVPIPTFFTNQPSALGLLSQTQRTFAATLQVIPLGPLYGFSCLTHQTDDQAIRVDATLTEPR